MRRFLHGFTLVELMVALALVGILATLAAPAFQGSMERSRADSDINELRTALSFARLEAINKSRSITVVATDADTGWTAGMTVKQGDAIVREFPAMKGGAELEAGDETELTFNNLGGVDEEVEFTYTRGSTTKNLTVCPTGRILMAEGC